MRAAVAILQLLFLVGDDRVTAGLAACGGDGQHRGDGQRPLDLFALLIHFPHIAVIVHAHGNRFGGVNNTAAADRQDEIDLFLFAKGDALVGQGKPRVGLHAAKLDKINVFSFQGGDNTVIQAALLDAAAAVVQQKLLGVRLQQLADLLLRIFPKDNSGG